MVIKACSSLQAGYRVVGLDIASQEEPVLQHAEYEFTTTDITSADQIQQLASHVGSQVNDLQVLVNNAGIADPYLPEDPAEKTARWHKVIQTNLTGNVTLHWCLQQLRALD